MLAASTSYPFFDPADFASSPSPWTVSPASSTSSMTSQHWVDAHASPYSSCGHLAAEASSSQTSLWTASTTSDDEQRCRDLLDQLEDEVSKLGDRTSPLKLKPTRSAPFAREPTSATAGPSSSRMVARAVVASSSTSTLRPSHPRRSRRISFTKTDLADLDIDAILEAYSHDGTLPPIETAAPPVRPARSQLRAAKSAVSLRTLRTDIFPTERAFPRPPQVTAQNLELHRTATDQSARSAHSATSGATATAAHDVFPHRRVAPFPTMERKKSSTSMRSMATRRPSAADAPPLPPLPAAHFSASSEHGSPAPSIRSNRTFSSFARQSTCSNTSSLASFASTPASSPANPSSSSARSHAMRSTLSRDSHYSTTSSSAASSFEANSFRWSVATSSTAPSDTDTASSSRRGSGPPLPAGAAALSTGKGRRFAAGAPRELDEHEHAQALERELEADLPASRRRVALGAQAPHDDDSDAERDHGGLISWEDFASELEALAPPPTVAPSHARRAGAAPPQQQQQYVQAASSVPAAASLKSGREGGKASRMRKISLATLRAR
ncbi:hypothetical protein JCM3775_000759 [Rhodotorula graminis]